jgi:hypothetical protein
MCEGDTVNHDEMILPDELRRAADRALAVVRRDLRHELPPGYREAVFAAFGPRRETTADDPPETPAHRRRAVLALLGVEKVLPLWEAATAGDLPPQRLLRQARDVLLGHGDREQIEREGWDVIGYMDMIAFAEAPSAAMVGLAAYRALGVALLDEPFDPAKIDYDETNADRDPWSTGGAEFAAWAAANGAPWNEESEPADRLAYWEWWLREAVPQAWRAVDERGALRGRWRFATDEECP